ncbi:MAG TPA: VOC family protein [Streptosporangiaceae bacterium]|nr:VOC family protein [Streptosporangiaceae bacterium]
MGNAVVHFEFGAADDEPLVAFYRGLFGWSLQRFAGGGYTMIDTCGGAGINGGIGKSQTGEPWSAFYVETDDPQAMLDRAISLGATTVLPVTNFGGAVTIAMFNDPDELLIGLVQAPADAAQSDQPAPSAGSGEAITWFEILGSDAIRTQQFYSELFGWTIDSAAFPGYVTAMTGADRGIQGGVGGGLEARWAIIYAAVRDLGKMLDRAVSLGGSRVNDQEVSALKLASRKALYGSSDDIQMAVIRDPAGNLLGLREKSAK